MNRFLIRWLQLSLLLPAAALAGQSEPPAAWSAGATYDVARGRLVVFGGYMRGYVGGTWEWDGRSWTRPTDTGPTPRNAPGLVYDEAHRQVLLFGGDRGPEGALNDTWSYDGRQWQRIATTGPSPRSIHTMVYDSKRERVVLFGGMASGQTLGDTWEWDGYGWKLMATAGPPARALHGMAYDRMRGRTVIYGGQTVLGPDAPSLADTWEWDGMSWTRVDVTPPGPRDHVAMSFDPSTGQVLLHGVPPGNGGAGETWAYDGKSWRRMPDRGPRRGGAKLVFDTGARQMLLYGGGDGAPTNELWARGDTGWARVH